MSSYIERTNQDEINSNITSKRSIIILLSIDILADLYNTELSEDTPFLKWLLYYLMLFPDFNVQRTLYEMCTRCDKLGKNQPLSIYWHGTIVQPGLWISLGYYLVYFTLYWVYVLSIEIKYIFFKYSIQLCSSSWCLSAKIFTVEIVW